jgi:hypothetical protein
MHHSRSPRADLVPGRSASWGLRALALAVAAVLAGACPYKFGDDRKEDGGGTDPPPPAADAAPPGGAEPQPRPTNCRGIRNCVFNCGKDKACSDGCVAQAPAAAQALYRMVTTCTMDACKPTLDEDCRCTHECFNGGLCFDAVDTCDDGVSDLLCEELCH